MFDITVNRQSTSQKEMMLSLIVRPITEAFNGMSDGFIIKLVFNVFAVATSFALGLFVTPEFWWKGLIWLVMLDWLSGIITSIQNGTFSFRLLPQKWYQATGYTIVCASAAIISNSLAVEMTEGWVASTLYYLQFFVYASFYIKEFISILRKWNLITHFQFLYRAVKDPDTGIDDVIEHFNEDKE